MRGRHKFLCLRDAHGGEEVWELLPETWPQPCIEEIREIGVADVVVVRWISANVVSLAVTTGRCAALLATAALFLRKELNALCNHFLALLPPCAALLEWVRLRIVPKHGQYLLAKGTSDCRVLRYPRAVCRREVQRTCHDARQVHANGIGICLCTSSTLAEWDGIMRHASLCRVSHHARMNFTQKVYKCRERTQVSSCEEVRIGANVVVLYAEPKRLFGNGQIRLPTRWSALGGSSVLWTWRQVDTLSFVNRDHRHEASTHAASTRLLSEVLEGDRCSRQCATKPLLLAKRGTDRCLARITSLANVEGEAITTHRQINVCLAALLAAQNKCTRKRRKGMRKHRTGTAHGPGPQPRNHRQPLPAKVLQVRTSGHKFVG